ncbi:MAG: hypothetical protein U5R49_08220 [Deltaproteobacteria bacterium]|nr:hypothetical protein [Deltaproteobacteria bacterium]
MFHVKDLSARIEEMMATLKEKTLHLNDIRIELERGRINVATQALSFPAIQFTSARLKNLKLSLESGKGRRIIELSGKNIGIAKWAGAFNLLPTGWTFSGGDALESRGRLDAAHNGTFSCKLTFPQMSFQNPEGTILGDRVDISAAIQGKADLKTGLVSADAALDATGGEALLDRFYVNLKKSPLSARVKGTYRIYDRHLELSSVALRLEEVFTCNLTGKIFEKDAGWQVDVSTRIPETPLKPLFGFFILDPFQMEKPFLKKLHVDGGVSAAIDLQGGRSDWTARGDLSWNAGTFRVEGNEMSLDGIDLSLPLSLRRPLPQRPPEGMRGHLSIRSMRVPPLPKQAINFPLESRPNSLIVDAPIDVKIPGGSIRIDPIKINALIGPSPRLTTGLSMMGVNIKPLLKGTWPQPVDGTMGGALSPIRLEGNRLTAKGNITASVFGGTVTVFNPGVSGLFTGAPVFRLNVRWDGLNLQKLTAGTEFGEIEGVLNGYAKNLEIAQGQPQKFDLFLETIETDNVPQRISVKAVDNIAQLGGGQSPFVGMAGTFAFLFKEFPYEKIGVHATLENDVFTINGTIHEGSKEYLVKRGLFSGVNVVNQNPDNRVGFKDMIKRFKRVTSSKSGPVIK